VTSVSKDITAHPLSENIKSQLQLLIPHLETDTATLVQDAGAIRSIYSLIKDELTPQLKEILQPVAYIECHEPKFSKALSRLVAREAQKDLPTQEQQCIENMISVKKVIDQLNDSLAKITQKLTTLNEEREQLLSKLKDVETSIRLEEDNLARIPTTLSEQKKKMSQLKFDLQSIKAKKKNPVPGTTEEDNQQIADVDSMRLKALDTVKSILDM
jgi:chromosome segregation ATPase